MKHRRPGRSGVGRFVVVGLVLALSVVASMSAPYWLVAIAPFAAVAVILVARRPANSIGWLLLGFICAASVAFAPIDATAAQFAAGTASPWAMARAVVAASVAAPGIFMVLLALTLVLPSGELPSGAWGQRARIALLAMGAATVVGAFGPTLSGLRFVGSDTQATVPNPLAIAPDATSWGSVVAGTWAVILGLLVAGAVSMLVRARHSRGIQRLQFQWIVVALAVVTVSVVVGSITGLFILAGVSLPLIPITIGISVMRYRLYEIDRLVSRTISYALISVVLGVVFAGAILVFQAVLAPATGENALGVAASTLIAAVLFQPIRRRIRSAVDHRFDRARYDGDQTAALFAGRLREEVDLARIAEDLTTTVEAALKPRVAYLWTRDRDQAVR